jgi:hypothetical protein
MTDRLSKRNPWDCVRRWTFLCILRSAKLCPTNNKHVRLMQGAHFRSHVRSANQRIQKVRGSWLTSLIIYLILFTHAALHIKSKGLSIDVPLSSILCFLYAHCRVQKARGSQLTSLIINIMFFTHATPRTESKGLPIDVPYHLSYAFYTYNITYKK